MKLFEAYNTAGNIKSFENFKLSFTKKDIPESYFPRIKEIADNALVTEVPMCPASLYREFIRNGNRTNYEAPYIQRREVLMNLIVGEFAFDDGRYIDKLIDVIWAICEESTWVLPAHNAHSKNTKLIEKQLGMYYEDDVYYIDLFSGLTGAQFALVLHLFGDKIEKSCPDTVVRRMKYEIERRIIHPMERHHKDYWWAGFKSSYVNNWNPWIVSNLLTVVAFCVEDLKKREELTKLCCTMIDAYINCIPEDGCCDEGASYFWACCGSLFNFFEMLDEISITPPDVLKNDLIVKMSEYVMKVHITGKNQYITFNDCRRFIEARYTDLARIGKLIGSEKLVAFAGKYMDESEIEFGFGLPYSGLKTAVTCVDKSDFKHENYHYFDRLQLMIARNEFNGREVFAACKAGSNTQSHGHLDCGSFILYIDSKPVFIDTGVPPYTKDSFNENRFKSKYLRSLYHNTPSVDDCEQIVGLRTQDTKCEERVISTELKGTFEANGILSLKRRIDASCGFMVEDTFEFDTERTYKFNLVSASKPVINNDVLSIDTPDGIHAEFDITSGMTVEYEEIREANRAVTMWDTDCIYRTVLYIQKQKGKFIFKLK